MKLLKFIPLLLILTLYNSSAQSQDCEDIKGNLVGKLFCKATGKSNLGIGKENKVTTETTTEASATEKKGILGKIWKRPEWTKKKKN